MQKEHSLKYSLLLLFTAMIWGSAFVAQSAGMEYVGPMTFIAVRFIIGGLILIPVALFFDSVKKKSGRAVMKWNDITLIKGGLLCGIFLFLASSAQQIGMQYTSTGKAGFITACYIVMVPILSLLLKKKPGKYIWISVAVATLGLYFLCIDPSQGVSLQKGDIYLFACAILFACQILAADKYAPNVDCLKLSIYEFLLTGILGIIPMIMEKPVVDNIMAAWISIGYASVFSCGIAYTLQIVAQSKVKPALASLLMSLESAFAVLFGFLILHQKLSLREGLGCVIMFTAVLLAQFAPSGKTKED